ncbi:hypothetical protein [Streptomyces sp. MZ04]|uniref:hypothetical protein n=1 Tax=Streptomyces sp. MZ04 TaxID=2559236 RepID=UPI001432F271|nr:hypothetical protein [Streptomyces sp. MZ04]
MTDFSDVAMDGNSPDSGDQWGREMAKDLPPLTRDQILTISVYRRVFPWMPWSLKRDPAAGDAA